MDRINHIHIIDKGVFLIIMLIGVFSQASAAESLGATIDCSDVKINYVDNPEWTHSERLKAMDRAFFESVDRFELCNLSNQSGTSSGSASEANQASGTGTSTGTSSGSESGLDSVASQEMTGTETESTLSQANSSESSNVPENANNASVKVNGGGSSKNGVKPKDIPSADNDDAIAAQIRLAAEIEKDPVKKEKLWNEYRKYKGLPVNDNK